MSELTATDAIAKSLGNIGALHRFMPADAGPWVNAPLSIVLAAARPLIERELREQIATEIETDQIEPELMGGDHDDQLDALTAWHAFAARGYCVTCDGRGHEYPDDPDEPCWRCAGYGTWGGASDAQ